MPVPGLHREDFPALDRFTYLNTASAGLVPASVVQPAHEFEAELAQAGTTGMDEDTEVGILEGARHAAAGLIVSPRVGSTRFSMHFYNNSDDVDRALAALDLVLR